MKTFFLFSLTLVSLALGLSTCGGNDDTGSPSVQQTGLPDLSSLPSPLPSVTPALSEQPDMAAFQKYFKELGLGKVPPGVKDLPTELQKNATVFAAGDQICLYGEIILECQIRNTVYDVATGKIVNEGGLPRPMTGGFAGWEPLSIPVGKYEYKVYVEDVLVAVFPFEVR